MAETEGSPVYKASRIHAGSVEETVDRISELPVQIIHQILSKLCQKEAAKTSVLSKIWYYCWTSRPNLVFDLLQHMPLEKFIKLVDQSIQPHLEHNLRIKEFNLQYHDAGFSPSQINKWIDLAVKHKVKVLKIDTLDYPVTPSPSYLILPDVIYGAKNLTTLRLSKYKFEFSSDSIRFCFLKDLYLEYVHISRVQLQKVLDSCPFITSLSLSNCKGICKLHAFGGLVHLEYLLVVLCELDSLIVHAPNLMKLTIVQGRELEEVEIRAPNLLEFIFMGDNFPFSTVDNLPYRSLPDVIYAAKMLTTLNLSDCRFGFTGATSIRFCLLKDFYLRYVHISQGQLQRILDRCPFITDLRLSYCKGIRKLHVLGGLLHLEYLYVASCDIDSMIVHAPNLMKLTIIEGRELEEVEIRAPNLSEFSYLGDKLPLSSIDPSCLESAELKFLFHFGGPDSIWSMKLQHFLQKFNYSKGLILVIYCFRTKSILIYEDPREIILPPISAQVNIFVAPMSHVESIIDTLMSMPLKIISVLPCRNSKVLQVLPEIKGVSNFVDISDQDIVSWYSWLKSTTLIDKVTTFTFNA